jgi:hypothetical protein
LFYNGRTQGGVFVRLNLVPSGKVGVRFGLRVIRGVILSALKEKWFESARFLGIGYRCWLHGDRRASDQWSAFQGSGEEELR